MKKILRAFTLVELLIASAIFLVVMLPIYSAFQSGIFGFRNIEETIDIYQTARQILERMNLDLRNSFAYSQDDAKFIGTKNEVSFLTLVDTFGEDTIVEDYAYVSYKLEENKLMRLCRKNKEALNDKSKIESDEMSSNIEKIDFSYGYIDLADQSLKFKDLWSGPDTPGEQGTLPVAIKVILTLKNKIKQDFQRTIFLSR